MNYEQLQLKITDIYKQRDNIDVTRAPISYLETIDKLKGINESSKLIKHHIERGSHIALVTDYDCDGITSATVLTKGFLEVLNYTNITTIVNRRKDGNGFNDILVSRILETHNTKKIDLIITADHASSDKKPIGKLRDMGIPTILTDHHTMPKDNFPDTARVVINPEQPGCEYNQAIDGAISGCFVAFLTIVGAHRLINNGVVNESKLYPLLPYVAVSTISDVMPLDTYINRSITDIGFTEMNSLRNPLWIALRSVFKIKSQYTHDTVQFTLAPLINTGSRVGVEDIVFSMLMAKTTEEAVTLIKTMVKWSNRRKREQKKLYSEVEGSLETDIYKNSIVTTINTPMSINGIVAGQIGGAYGLPTICFIDNGESDVIYGSARSIIDGVNLPVIFRTISLDHPGMVVKYGGHIKAAGVGIKKEFLNTFKKLINDSVPVYTGPQPIVEDIDIPLPLVNYKLPFAMSNSYPVGNRLEPVICKTRMTIAFVMVFGNMVKFAFINGKAVTEGMYFPNPFGTFTHLTAKDDFRYGDEVDVYYHPNISNFGGLATLQLSIKNVRRIL